MQHNLLCDFSFQELNQEAAGTQEGSVRHEMDLTDHLRTAFSVGNNSLLTRE